MNPDARRTTNVARGDELGTDARRRRVLEQLRRDSHRMSEEELAARIASGDDEEIAVASDEAVRDVHVALRHFDLPKVSDAGFVSWDPGTGTVRPAENADLSEVEYRQLFADGWDDADALDRHERRRAVLDVLADADADVSLEDLAVEVAAREGESEPSRADVEEVAVALYHRHLPKLGDAGLVEYDAGEGTVHYREDAESRWWESPPAPPDSTGHGGPDRD